MKIVWRLDMAAMKIRYMSPPARCEICHQFDRFDAQINHCSRCAGTITEAPLEKLRSPYVIVRKIDRRGLRDALMIGAITIALLAGIWVAIVFSKNYLLLAILILLTIQLCRQ